MTELFPNSQYDIKIKWPNDILVNKKKIAGILIENQFNGNNLASSVIGVGLNVNQTEFGELALTATSLNQELHQEFDIETILNTLCSKLEKWYLKLKANQYNDINLAYIDKLYGLHQTLSFIDVNNTEFEGTIVGVAIDGKLILKTNGETILFDLKQLKFKL